ncbi:MAG: caspase family protein [Bacteroidetes bacterium]|nr:caspase family protein [Bacteroidota bacterium]
MKTIVKIISLIIPISGMIAADCHAQRNIGGYYTYETECMGVELDGSQTLKAWGSGRNRTDAIEQAKKNAIRDVLFKGITDGKPECNKKPVIFEVNAQEKYEDYFNVFFADGGAYKEFISQKDGSDLHLQVIKDRKQAGDQETYGVVIRVLRSQLKARMKADNIIHDDTQVNPPNDHVAEAHRDQGGEAAVESETKYRGGGDPLKGLNTSEAKKEMQLGDYYALIIGIDKYSKAWTPLDNAVNDAKAVESLLKEKYKIDYFSTLYDQQATREAIINEMIKLVENVKENDNVLIYFSGHGEFNEALNKGYWVPIDATSASVAKYISNSDIQTFLAGIKSKHTLLISDACFSGDIFRGKTTSVPFEDSEKYYTKVHGLKSRQAITSGGVEPVMDGGQNGHSVFAYYLLSKLDNNSSKYYDASQLYDAIKIPVSNNSDQSPKLNPIKNSGDEGGQFIFIKKQ